LKKYAVMYIRYRRPTHEVNDILYVINVRYALPRLKTRKFNKTSLQKLWKMLAIIFLHIKLHLS